MLISYAQNFEDVILWRALKDVVGGFYLDVGAQDPTIDSISRAFYDRGWRGIHVEPTPYYAARLRAERPDERVIEAAVSTEGGTLMLYQVAGTGLSTARDEFAAQHRQAGHRVEPIGVATVRLCDLLESAPGGIVHWLKIDVEGMERAVIESWGESAVRPWIVVIESTKPNSTELDFEGWEPLVLARGYRFAYFDGLNRFYVSAQHSGLLKFFGPGPHVFDSFALSGTAQTSFAAVLKSQIDEGLNRIKQLENEARTISTNYDDLISKNEAMSAALVAQNEIATQRHEALMLKLIHLMDDQATRCHQDVLESQTQRVLAEIASQREAVVCPKKNISISVDAVRGWLFCWRARH